MKGTPGFTRGTRGGAEDAWVGVAGRSVGVSSSPLIRIVDLALRLARSIHP